MKIVVLAGGLSTERHVGLTTGTGACRALREKGHQAIFVDMFLGLENYKGKLEDIFDAPDGLCPDNRVESQAPDLEAVRRSRKDQGPSMLGKDVLTVCQMADMVFLALHGSCGEDGRIQATLDLLGVPYTGSGYLGSGMAMDKSVTKRMMDSIGVRTAPWHDVYYAREDIPRLVEELEVPCAVKIVNGGSSIGVDLPDTKEELRSALEKMLVYGNHVVVEKKIRGREIQIGVLGNEYLPAVEIIPKGEYFDYVCKYQSGGAEEICPALITDDEWKQIGEMALKLHNALDLKVYSRADFILDEEGKAWCLEVNTLPGMTPTSLVPQEAAQIGLSYADLCEKIVKDSFAARKAEKV
ncbi:MAG: D-alanine--D-alanine ligase [Clostridiales bacterium]|nr:D-alanine--D-alanine ligase [Candidatus Cacconaster stercorequi]